MAARAPTVVKEGMRPIFAALDSVALGAPELLPVPLLDAEALSLVVLVPEVVVVVVVVVVLDEVVVVVVVLVVLEVVLAVVDVELNDIVDAPGMGTWMVALAP